MRFLCKATDDKTLACCLFFTQETWLFILKEPYK